MAEGSTKSTKLGQNSVVESDPETSVSKTVFNFHSNSPLFHQA